MVATLPEKMKNLEKSGNFPPYSEKQPVSKKLSKLLEKFSCKFLFRNAAVIKKKGKFPKVMKS